MFYLRFCKFYTPTFKRFCLIFSHVLATKSKKLPRFLIYTPSVCLTFGVHITKFQTFYSFMI